MYENPPAHPAGVPALEGRVDAGRPEVHLSVGRVGPEEVLLEAPEQASKGGGGREQVKKSFAMA